MPDDAYRSLATRLDEIPNGFPATESGVELRLLAKMFTPEEARLASSLRLAPEPAAAVAARVNLAEETALDLLNAMAAKRVVRVADAGGGPSFSLMPFVVGLYELWLPRMDEEFATLFEAYCREGGIAGIVRDGPPIHRVIPVDAAIPFEVEIFPYERASALLGAASSWGVRDCICRVQKGLLGESCGRPVEACLVFAPVANAFANSPEIRSLSRDEALDVLREAGEAGLIHSSGNYRRGIHYICNCCTCCCGVMRGMSEFGIHDAVARSGFRAVVDAALCTGCGTCLDRCQFEALTVTDGSAEVELARCTGCGLCVTTCPPEALRLVRAPRTDAERPPATILHWMRERAENRGISLDDIA
jgi:Na+-translocating ferredoxin:NAD+ oxidoreductase subunit B